MLGVEVRDRTGVILEIFANHAVPSKRSPLPKSNWQLSIFIATSDSPLDTP
jgi:hypothetical protein